MPLTSLLCRLRGSVRSSAFESSMEAEVRHHLVLEIEALMLGRTFWADDDSPNAPAVLLGSHSFWQNALTWRSL